MPMQSLRTRTIVIPLVVLRLGHLLRDWYGLPAPMAKAEARRRVECLVHGSRDGEVVEAELMRAALATLVPAATTSSSRTSVSPSEGNG